MKPHELFLDADVIEDMEANADLAADRHAKDKTTAFEELNKTLAGFNLSLGDVVGAGLMAIDKERRDKFREDCTRDPNHIHGRNWPAWVVEIREGSPYFALPDEDAIFLDHLIETEEPPSDLDMHRLITMAKVFHACRQLHRDRIDLDDDVPF